MWSSWLFLFCTYPRYLYSSVYLRFMSPRVNSGFSLFRPISSHCFFLLQILHGIFQLLHLLCLAFVGVHWVPMRSGARHPSIIGILLFHLGSLCKFLGFPWLPLYWFRLSRVRIVGLIALPLGVCCLLFLFSLCCRVWCSVVQLGFRSFFY